MGLRNIVEYHLWFHSIFSTQYMNSFDVVPSNQEYFLMNKQQKFSRCINFKFVLSGEIFNKVA